MMKTLESSAQSTIDDQFYLISRAFRGARLMLGNIIQSLPIIAEDDNPSRTLACIGSPPYDVPFFFFFNSVYSLLLGCCRLVGRAMMLHGVPSPGQELTPRYGPSNPWANMATEGRKY
jgi:hypothetical protein